MRWRRVSNITSTEVSAPGHGSDPTAISTGDRLGVRPDEGAGARAVAASGRSHGQQQLDVSPTAGVTVADRGSVAQHTASPSAPEPLPSWSASPVFTYHSHRAPSGSVTQVSILVA